MFSLGYDYLEQSRTPLLGWQNLCASINYGGADWMFESGWKPAGLKTPGGGLFLGPYTSEGVGLTWRAGIIQPNFLGGPIGDAVNLGKLAANDVVDGGWLAVIKAGADVTYSIIARVREKHKSKISKSKIKYEDASAALKDGKATIEQCVKVLTSGYNDEEKKKAAEKIYDIVNGLLNSGDSKALNQTDLKKLEKAVVKNEHYFNHEKLAIIRSYIDARRLDPGGSKTFGFAEKLANSKNMGLGMLGGLASSLFQVNELAIGIPARLKWHNGNVFESIFEGTFRFDHIKGAKNIFGKTLGLLKDTAGDIFKIATQTMQTISPIYFRSTELSEHARHNIRKAINENELLFKKENLNEKDWKTIDANVAYITKMAPMIIGMGSNRSIYAKLKQHIGKYGAYYEANSLETQPAHIYEESGYLMKKQYINPAFLNAYLSLKIMDMKGDIRQEQVANNALKKAEETINSSDFPENHRDAFNKALSNVFDLTSKNSRVVSDFSEALRQIVQNKGDLLKFYQESGGLFDLFREIHDISDYSSLHRTAFINAFSKQGDAAALKQAFTLAVELAANELEGLSRDIKEGKGIDREKYHNLTQQLVLMRWMMDLFPGVYSDASTQLMKSLIGPLKMMDDKPKKENPDAPLDQFRLAYTVLCLGLIPQEYIASHQGAFDNITTLLRKSEYYGAASEIEMKLK
jgi:hypothetical protein